MICEEIQKEGADKMNYTDPPQSRNEEIIKAIIDETPYTALTQSRNEAILKSIIDDTEYTKEPQSRMEELLLELKEVIASSSGSFVPIEADMLVLEGGTIE